MREVETLIVGGGPAGSACAWELRKGGREPLILERQALPKSKLCAGWITPKVLGDLGIAPRSYPHGLLELDQIRVHLGRSPVGVTFPTRQYSIRRVEFDNWLLERSGCEIVRHCARAIVREEGFYVVDGLFRSRYLVGAGGTQCPVRRTFFGPDHGSLILTQEVEYRTRPRQPVCSLFFPFRGLASYAWYVPKADAVNIGFGGLASRFRGNIKAYWNGFVDTLLARGLIDARPPAPASHPYYAGDRKKTLRNGNAFIAGDAAGLATLDMGEGIGPAVESGILAARQIQGLDSYSPDRISKYTLDGLLGRLLGRALLSGTAKARRCAHCTSELAA